MNMVFVRMARQFLLGERCFATQLVGLTCLTTMMLASCDDSAETRHIDDPNSNQMIIVVAGEGLVPSGETQNYVYDLDTAQARAMWDGAQAAMKSQRVGDTNKQV